MSDDEVLHAAQQRLERRRAAMTPAEIERLRKALAEWSRVRSVEREERQRILRRILTDAKRRKFDVH